MHRTINCIARDTVKANPHAPACDLYDDAIADERFGDLVDEGADYDAATEAMESAILDALAQHGGELADDATRADASLRSTLLELVNGGRR